MSIPLLYPFQGDRHLCCTFCILILYPVPLIPLEVSVGYRGTVCVSHVWGYERGTLGGTLGGVHERDTQGYTRPTQGVHSCITVKGI